jgi:uncharacterized protein YqeY
MKVQEKIKKDMVQAMRDHETEKLNLLRVVIGEFNRIGKDIDDQKAIKIIRNMHENAVNVNNKIEAEILDSYLPKMYSEEQVRVLVANIIKGNDYKSMKDIGGVMKALNNNPDTTLINKKYASEYAKELLS